MLRHGPTDGHMLAERERARIAEADDDYQTILTAETAVRAAIDSLKAAMMSINNIEAHDQLDYALDTVESSRGHILDAFCAIRDDSPDAERHLLDAAG